MSCLPLMGQDYPEVFMKGLKEHAEGNFEESIKYLTLALDVDSIRSDIYYINGNSRLYMSQFEKAISNYTLSLDIDSTNIDAIYNRSISFAQLLRDEEAFSDICKVIEIDRLYPSALTLRGQIKTNMNDYEGACKDFEEATQAGDREGELYISKYCMKTKNDSEELVLVWNENENWKEQTAQENTKMKIVEFLKENETFENWTDLGTLITYKGITGSEVEQRAVLLHEQTKMNCPQSKLTIIEMEKKNEYPWIIFSLENPVSGKYKTPESQIWLCIQGKASLYLANRAIKKDKIPEKTKTLWMEFFKLAKIQIKK